jgi:hypothetical protein
VNAHVISLAAVLALLPLPALAQVHVGIQLGLPAVPQMVVVSPGIQVMEGYEGEVFLQGGWYWCRRPDGWYRSNSPRGNFGWVDARRVPGGLSRIPAGRYHNWHHDGDARMGGRPGQGRSEGRGDEGRGRDGGHRRDEGHGREEGGHHEH